MMRGMTKNMGRAAGLLCLGLAWPVWAADVTGTLHWLRRVEMSTPVSGVVAETGVDAGAAVRKGQVLVRLDARTFQAAVRRAEAVVRKCKEARAEAKRELERTTELYARTLIADHELQLAKIAHAASEAELQTAEAELTQAQLDLEYSRVIAPFDALVLARSAEVGQTVVTRLQSVPLITLAEAGHMLARIEVTDQELAQLKVGQPLTVKVDGRRYEGKVHRLGLEPVIAAGGLSKYEADVLFEFQSQDVLRAGQNATVELP